MDSIRTLLTGILLGCLLPAAWAEPPEVATPNGTTMDATLIDWVEDLRTDLAALRASLQQSQDAMLEGIDPDLSLEEKRRIVTEWHAANADKIAEAQRLHTEIQNALRQGSASVPDRASGSPADTEMPDEIEHAQRELERRQEELAQSRLEALRFVTDPDEVREKLTEWRREQGGLIERIQRLNSQVAAWVRDQHSGTANGAEPSELEAALAENAAEIRAIRNEVADTMRETTNSDERRETLRALREEQRALIERHQELRQQQAERGR